MFLTAISIDSAILVFREASLWKTAPARQEVAAPIEPRSVDTSKIKVIVTKNGKIYQRSTGCKSLPQNAIKTSVPLAAALSEARRPPNMLPANSVLDLVFWVFDPFGWKKRRVSP